MRRVVFQVTCVALLAFAPVAMGQVFYVDVNATGAADGGSWTDAFTEIQEGVEAAAAAGGGEVWVAEGMYSPVWMWDDPVYSDIILLGGFASGDTIDDRDPESKVVVIDGGGGTRCMVVGAEPLQNVLIDGFTLRNGFDDTWMGAGLLIQNLDATNAFRNIVIQSSHAEDGADSGGIGAHVSAAELENILVEDCTSSSHGGGIGLHGCDGMVLTNVTVRNCTAADGSVGGAAVVWGGNVTFIGCTFENNSAGWAGGALGLWTGGNYTVTDCTFTDNSDGGTAFNNGGGGIYAEESTVNITGGLFTGNAPTAVFFHNQSRGSVVDSVFMDQTDSGVLSVSDVAADEAVNIINTAFFRNVTSANNGIYHAGFGNGSVNIVNCTFAHNDGYDGNDGTITVWGDADGAAVTNILNTIAWDNNLEQGVDTYADWAGGQATTVNYSLIDSGWDIAEGTDNLSEDPFFVNPDDFDLRLLVGSPALNAGDGTDPLVPEFDFMGTPRDPVSPSMGIYEEGVSSVTIPDMSGLSQSAAIAELEELGLVVTVYAQHHETVPEDEVIGTNPEVGALLAEGGSVELLVSLGPEEAVHVPVAGLAALLLLGMGLGALALRRARG